MKLTKHEHACVVFEKDGESIVVDPGSFSSGAADIIAGATAILITHEHLDHVNQPAIIAALAARPELKVYAPRSMAVAFDPHKDQFTGVAAGDSLTIGGFSVSVHGTRHALIHPDIPVVPNVGYFVDESVYHPGDAFYVPHVEHVGTLLLPTSGPWMKIGEAADYVRTVKPDSVVQIHEMLLSDIGLGLAANLLGKDGLTRVPLIQVPVGNSIMV